MKNTLLIEITNKKAIGLLHELEELHLIKVLKGKMVPQKKKLSEKYKGAISKEKGKELKEHIAQMRNEWSDI